MSKKNLKNTYYSDLRCKCCGYLATIPRKKFDRRAKGHIKTMWCPFCGDEKDFVENSEETIRTLADAEAV